MFHDRDTLKRMQAVSKAAEHSAFELYLFLAAFLHSAPQIITQMSFVLREGTFRDYKTSKDILFVIH